MQILISVQSKMHLVAGYLSLKGMGIVSSIKSLLCQMGMDPNSKYNKLIQERKIIETVDLDTLKR